MEEKIDIFIFLKENGEKKKLKDCTYIKEFIYKRENFIIISDSTFFRVCYLKDKKDYYSIWSSKIKEEGIIKSYNEALSEFRKGYDKNDIKKEDIVKFIDFPTKFLQKKKTKKKS